MVSRSSRCPAHDCNRGASRQIKFSRDVLERAGVVGNWLDRALRCSYCGTVYTVESTGAVIHGYWDSILGVGWKEAKDGA